MLLYCGLLILMSCSSASTENDILQKTITEAYFKKGETAVEYKEKVKIQKIILDFPKGVFNPKLHVEFINTGAETVEAVAIMINASLNQIVPIKIMPGKNAKTTITFDAGVIINEDSIKITGVALMERDS